MPEEYEPEDRGSTPRKGGGSMNGLFCESQIFTFIYAILTYNSIHICKCHVFLVTLLMQSNKRSVFPHNGNSPIFIIAPPSPFLISTGHVPFA